MAVRLVFLGRLEDAASGSERVVPAGTLADILAQLEADLALALRGDRIRLALNGVLVNAPGDLVMQDGDELAFLPPVSGG